MGAAVGGVVGYNLTEKLWKNSTIELPIFALSPEEMFLNKIAMLDVNFINPNKYDNVYQQDSAGNFIATDEGDDIDGDGTPDGVIAANANGEPTDPSRALSLSDSKTSVALELQETVATWYVALRNLAIVMLLCILVYVGIRMVISSAAKDKAKYKQMLLDWLVAMCLLFCLHYIMSFALSITDSLNKLFQKQSYTYIVGLPSTKGYTLDTDGATDKAAAEQMKETLENDDGFGWPTNLMGKVRLEMQLSDSDSEEYDNSQIGYTMVYLVLVIYTVMFLFIYLKRVLYIAFLTLIAPLVAMTYPLDKMNDGKAQAFNMWLKEYIFTLLIQPVHALIYTVFVSMAINFASSNVIYTLVCIGFILQAEKIIRKFFGFEKAGAFPIMNSALGGAMVMQGMNMLRGKGKKEKEGKNGNVRTKTSPNSRGDSEHMDVAGTLAGGNTPLESAGDSNNNRDYSEQAEEQFERDWAGVGDSSEYAGGAADGDSSNGGSSNAGSSSSSSSTGDLPGRKARIKGYLKTAGKYALQSAGQSAIDGINKIPGTLTRLPLAATLGTIGVAAGLASDNGANVAKYGAAGAGIGYALSKGKNIDTESIKDDALRDVYGKDYKEYMNQQSDKAWQKDHDAVNAYKEKYGSDYKEKMEIALKFRQNGVTDDKIIIKAMNAPGSFGSEDSNERIALARMASQVSSAKDLEQVEKRLKKNGALDGRIKETLEAIRYIKGFEY